MTIDEYRKNDIDKCNTLYSGMLTKGMKIIKYLLLYYKELHMYIKKYYKNLKIYGILQKMLMFKIQLFSYKNLKLGIQIKILKN